MNQISKGVGNCPWVCWFGSILKTPLNENHFKKLWQFGRQQRVIDRTFQILKAFIFTIGLTFLQAKSMSNKFAITLQDQFCSYSTSHSRNSDVDKTARDKDSNTFPYRDLHGGVSWGTFHIAFNSFWSSQSLPSFAHVLKLLWITWSPHLSISRKGNSFFSFCYSVKSLRKKDSYSGPLKQPGISLVKITNTSKNRSTHQFQS